MEVDEPLAKRSMKPFEKRARALVEAQRRGDARTFTSIRRHHPRLPGRSDTNERNPISDARLRALRLSLADARCIVARTLGFHAWADLKRHIAALQDRRSRVSRFESAAEAIVGGDEKALARLLREDPRLVRARSAREHHATLLHYVGGNAVESHRQKSPKNTVRLAEMLLAAGAEVDADLDYGPLKRRYPERVGSTTLGMVATSVHPAAAGVQIPLLETLVRAGAAVDGLEPGWNIVRAALANGRPEAAEFLAARGARLDLATAAGVGRLGTVESCLGRASPEQLESAFQWACSYGRSRVVKRLLRAGVAVSGRGSQTPLHAAAFNGHGGIVALLLQRGAAVDVKDGHWGGTPLGWALYGWANPAPEMRRANHHEVVARLVAAGARVDREWLGGAVARKLRGDRRMRAALGV